MELGARFLHEQTAKIMGPKEMPVGTPSPKLQKGRDLPPQSIRDKFLESPSDKDLLDPRDTGGNSETFLELPSRGSCYSQRGLFHPPGKGTEQELLWDLGSGEAASLGVIFVSFFTHLSISPILSLPAFLSLYLPLRPPSFCQESRVI